MERIEGRIDDFYLNDSLLFFWFFNFQILYIEVHDLVYDQSISITKKIQ